MAHANLCMLAEARQDLQTGDQITFDRYAAWVQARRGYLDGPACLDRSAAPRGADDNLITDYVCVYRFEGLSPFCWGELTRWIQRGLPLLDPDAPPNAVFFDRTAFREHHGYALLHAGKPEAALQVLETAYRAERSANRGPRIYGRLLATLGETHRVLGGRCRALALFREAQRLQTEGEFRGDLAEFTLTGLAKLARTRNKALALLERVRLLQTEVDADVGLARTWLLEARLSGERAVVEESRRKVESLREHLPGLAACPLLQTILTHWDEWTGGGPSPTANRDEFWGL